LSPVIVIPAFSREMSLARLLESIQCSSFPKNTVKIIITLDGGYSKSVLDVAEKFVLDYPKSNVEIVKRAVNIGLKEHILWCGDLTIQYESVIILEDDLIVANDFYQYANEALEFYKDIEDIAGISLYGQKYNEYANLPFEAIPNGSDTYFMQVASSWGQAWTKKQWVAFKEWYKNVDSGYIKNLAELPSQVSNWPETSWKKFFSAFIVEQNKYFAYPFVSRTSNCADSGGQHTKNQINYLQTPLSLNYYSFNGLNFCEFTKQTIKYDAFMEVVMPDDFYFLGKNISLIAIDLYGIKPEKLLKKFEYTITSKKCKEFVTQIPIRYKPIENNIFLFKEGNSLNNLLFCFKYAETKSVVFNDQLNERIYYSLFIRFFSYCNFNINKFTFSYLISLTLLRWRNKVRPNFRTAT
jgi:hypothetical protein